MHTATEWSNPAGSWPRRTLVQSRDWLDQRGRAAWIIATVIGFVLFWPVGLALLVYIFWSNRMTCNSWGRRAHRHNHRGAVAATGNTAFDAYRAETLKRLEEERAAFTSFLDQLRAAKDQAEFEQFMSSRRTPEAA